MSNGLPDWKVQSVTPYTDFVVGRGPVEGSMVAFVTTNGLSGSVFIPAAELANTDKVRDLIVEKVTHLNAISDLTS